jgi:hypothetical protein
MYETLEGWMSDHHPDYVQSLTRAEKTRTLLLSGTVEKAEEILRNGYVFAVFSIQTGLERHERSFTEWASGSDLGKAAAGTVYGNQKTEWITNGFENTEWDLLAEAVRCHAREGRFEELLEVVVDELKGVSYRKASFMLAMSGLYEYICVDSNVANFAGLEESTGNALNFTSSKDYFETCEEIIGEIPNPLGMPPFLIQWAIYDYQREEHARHTAFYREVLPEVLWDRKS